MERRDARRRVSRTEDHESDSRAPVLLCVAQLLADRAHRHRAVLGLDDDPQVASACDSRVQGQDEVTLLGFQHVARVRPGPVQQVARPAGQIAEHRLEQVLEVAALGGGSGAFGATCGRSGLDRNQSFLERLEAGRHLLAELVHRRVEPGRI
jgi:hypothetical protein